MSNRMVRVQLEPCFQARYGYNSFEFFLKSSPRLGDHFRVQPWTSHSAWCQRLCRLLQLHHLLPSKSTSLEISRKIYTIYISKKSDLCILAFFSNKCKSFFQKSLYFSSLSTCLIYYSLSKLFMAMFSGVSFFIILLTESLSVKFCILILLFY